DSAPAEKIFGPADQHRRQVVHLGAKLNPDGAVRMERLRGFGAAPGMLTTCACSRIEFFDGSHGVLVVGATAAPGAKASAAKPTMATQVTTARASIAPLAAPVPAMDDVQPSPSHEAPGEF